MAENTLSPRFRQLQPELILQIFEAVCFQGDTATALKLSHVSSWVQPVVESQIYHTVVLSTMEQIASFAYAVTKRPASFFQKHVRRLCVAPPQSHLVSALPNISSHRNFKRMIASILTACSHVDDLCIDQSYLTETETVFSCRPTFVFMVTSSMIFCSFPTVMLSNVTHLYLLNGQIHPDMAQKISRLPSLTHMAISYAMNTNMAYVLRTINALLSSRTLVRLLILPWQMFAAGQSEASFSLEQSRLLAEMNKLRDNRIVLVPRIIGKEEQRKLWKEYGMNWSSLKTITAGDNKSSCVQIDILPIRQGHTLVVPKIHCRRVSELPPDVAAAVGAAVSKVANALTKALENTALNIVCNQEYAQAVPHVHYHIVPAPISDHSDHAPVSAFAPLTNFEMHRQEICSRHLGELDEEEGHKLCQKIKNKL